MTARVERWTPERRRELTRSALIEAAASVFARRGLQGASLEEIAETAGFTRGAIYKNFANKEELFLAVFERRMELNLAAFSERFESGRDIVLDPSQIARAWHDIEVRERDPQFLALELEARLLALRNDDFRERYVAHHRRMNDAVAAFSAELASQTGVSTSISPARLARMLSIATEGFVAWAILDPEDDEYEDFVAFVMSALIDGEPPAP